MVASNGHIEYGLNELRSQFVTIENGIAFCDSVKTNHLRFPLGTLNAIAWHPEMTAIWS
jgi:hypothetical protein